jgi:serine-type D-Ala-D-Ala carboxypeptidase/endopeptidase (penicillin-binding protein 4)
VELSPVPAPRPVLRSKGVGVARLNRPQLSRLLSRELKSAALGHHAEADVGSLAPGGRVLHVGARDPVTPASLLKLLTVSAALEVLGPDHRFDTAVVQGHSKHNVVLVGGGDPLLTAQRFRPSAPNASSPYPPPASLTILARRSAERLKSAGVSRVLLSYDASRFTGPAADPSWPASYRRTDVVSPISALWVNEGRAGPLSPKRVSDPAATAAQRFAGLLRAQGLTVARTVGEEHAPRHSRSITHVLSAPLSAIVQHILETSDNEGAEVLLRQVAVATGHPGSFASGVRAVRRTLTGLGVDLSGATFSDGSGLARTDTVPLRVLIDILRLASGSGRPELHPLVSSLPVAGFTGSLAYRFTSDAPEGLGVVRAKTGTLTGVQGLAGIIATPAGKPLVFAVVADHVPASRTLAARGRLDSIAAAIASCDCTR